MSHSPYSWLSHSLDTIHRAHWYRSVQTLEGLPGAIASLRGQKVINFASNNYLGLAGDRRLIAAAREALEQYGTGSTGSRLTSGHRDLHRDLERSIAQLKQTEDALVFSSGYLANLGAIAALVGPRDLILSDEYNHSSLKNGAILSKATVVTYGHKNVKELTEKLQEYRKEYRRSLILTDSIFSMDGDRAPLPQYLEIAQTYNSMLLIDEAHATGVLGSTGAGLVEHFQLGKPELIQVGTLSKAVGSLGGYVAGSSILIDYLRNRAPSWIYTTGLSPADTAAAQRAIEIIQTEPQHREQLWQNIAYFQDLLTRHCPQIAPIASESPIICLPLETPKQALELSQFLKTQGIFAPAIRPPTVPTSRIRISLMATHQREHLESLVDGLKQKLLYVC
ncbi:8-amino-7-oxononanoate synthase [Roseofilum sp. BLCC_M91]|uniref:8-amino-7-ketopelargonate synthase n=1 Tax=Roseofilum halophilum BLCC-M91 TaxID=3022259 RepID=A0ABT7BMW8_9CYAN|nr:8-amino-7-oxononanoate synthase [Roseofilum halophilum]MDJ1180543.1 8-amino-7-oxononanoate synthase [Roseofilum halophilum BLCC-M91]